jgi:uncharacterized delta-60 repeat protein
VVCGNTLVTGDYDFAVARYNTNGSLDTTFNGTGIFIASLSGATDDVCYSVNIQTDGKIILGGYYFNGANFQFGIARLNSNGSFDTTFNTTGYVITSVGTGFAFPFAVALQPDNKILLGGFGASGVSDDFAIIRYNTNGSLDTSFGTTGITFPSMTVNEDRAYSLQLQSDGKIVLAGRSQVGAFYDFIVARYR